MNGATVFFWIMVQCPYLESQQSLTKPEFKIQDDCNAGYYFYLYKRVYMMFRSAQYCKMSCYQLASLTMLRMITWDNVKNDNLLGGVG